MRVTISKTIELDSIPDEIDENYNMIEDRIERALSLLQHAASDAREGRYIDSAEIVEEVRQSLLIIDKNMEEQQSLCLSYEKLRIANQMPETQSAPPDMEELKHD
tara:strand:- start:464 stop:778 length:315 start_codon:yes stop_codon:yes gene_type:complete